MTRAPIGPTVTHKIRAFLLQHGVVLAPWSGLDLTYRRLYELLNQRRDDPAFWQPVADLIRSIVRCATDPGAARLTTPHAELLSSWEIDELVADLREALPGGDLDGDDGALRAFAQRLSAPVLGGFLLFGLVASGCGSSVTVSDDAAVPPDAGSDATIIGDASDDVPTDGPIPPWAESCDLNPSSVLYQAIDAANLDDWAKGELCQCFTELNASWNDGLTELFQSGTPETIAAALEEMLECCSYGYMPPAGDFDAVVDQLLDGSLCEIPMPYAGVSFPEE